MERMDEALIREIVAEVVSRLMEKKEGILVGVSNRHIHLSVQDYEKLFGPDHRLTRMRDLTQPGEFAAAQTVNISGPKGMIKDVRVLGPYRENTQIEISKTDGYLLGIKVPVRESGKISGTPGIVIDGPYGRISKESGLIVAQRHIHLDPKSAESYGVVNGSMVSVRAEGERGMVFDHVLVRVSEKYRPELHIDTDEANASDLKSGDYVRLVNMPECKTEKQIGSGKKRRFITKEDVVRAKQDGSEKIIADRDTKVTPYAKEIAGELGVEILCISQTW